MNTIPTAEDFITKNCDYKLEGDLLNDIIDALQNFAKLHVRAALKAASYGAEAYNKPKFSGDINPQVDMDSILNAYPLNNIK